MRIIGFPPLIDSSSRILILGSMPSVQSLKMRQYYGNPRNQFWQIMENLLKHDQWDNYAHKTRTLLDNKIALWDVIYSCQRKGSLDSNLCHITVNDFKQFLRRYPAINAVFAMVKEHFNCLNDIMETSIGQFLLCLQRAPLILYHSIKSYLSGERQLRQSK